MDSIGSESIARMHEDDDNRAMAAVHRLTPEQAIAALAYLSGIHPAAVGSALEYATDGEYRADGSTGSHYYRCDSVVTGAAARYAAGASELARS